jgi:hypothetical protein
MAQKITERLSGPPRHIRIDPPFTIGEFYLLSIAVCGSGLIGLILGGSQ